jgi:restriction system protein
MDEATFILLLIGGAIGYFFYLKQKHQKVVETFQDTVAQLMGYHDDMKEFLALGIYHKFKEDPFAFEEFMAKVLEDYYGGQAVATQKSADFGIDIVHEREAGRYLGQVKCYAPDNGVGYEPIALIHSQMEKQEAKGGYVITTSYFTNNALKYWEELQQNGVHMNLIDSPKVVEMYVGALETKKRYVYEPNPVVE